MLDTSYSMWTIENGSTRLEKAKSFIENYNSPKIWVFSFWEDITYNFPLSENTSILSDILKNIKLWNISAWENIIEALSWTIENIKNISWDKNIVLLTDGGKKEIDFKKIEKKLADNKINLTVIWIWENKASNLTLTDSSGQSRQVKDNWLLVSSSQNPSLELAKTIKNWKYYDIKDYKSFFWNYEIILILLTLIYLWTYLKLK